MHWIEDQSSDKKEQENIKRDGDGQRQDDIQSDVQRQFLGECVEIGRQYVIYVLVRSQPGYV